MINIAGRKQSFSYILCIEIVTKEIQYLRLLLLVGVHLGVHVFLLVLVLEPGSQF